MQLRILGGLEAHDDDGRRLDLGGPKQRTVLAALAVALGNAVPAVQLQERVWGDDPPANPETSLQAYISNLRRALEPDRQARQPARVLVTQPAGYALHLPRRAVDATAFEDEVRSGRAALAQGDAVSAHATLGAARERWVGPPLPELGELAWVEDATAWLTGLRRQALEAWVESGLLLGRHEELLPSLERAIAEHPFHERLRAQHALALYRCGRQRDALDALAAARTALLEEVGIDPGPELRQLEADILEQSAALDARPPVVPAPAPRLVVPRLAATGHQPDDSDSGTDDSGTNDGAFVGRTRELEMLLDVARVAASGAGRPVVVSGEPGIGKTRLVEELVRRLPASTVVAWGRCPESAAAAAYWPCIQIGRQLEGADVLPFDLIADLLPSEDAPLQTDDPTADRLELHVSVAKLLASAERPLVLVIDDLQWADQSSLRVIEFVAGELRSQRVLLVVTARPVAPDAPLALIDCLGELARQPGAVRIELAGLGADAVQEWIERRGGRPASRDVADAVVDRTGGNPFFVGEVMALLAAEGGSVGVEGVRRGLPAAVQDVVRRRVSRLPVDAQRSLSVASVIGRAFDLDVLARVAGVDLAEVLDHLDAAVTAGVVVETDRPGRFEFSHAIVADTLAAEVAPGRRARLHAATALALEALRTTTEEGTLADMAHHAVEGAMAGTAPQAYEWSVQAARHASTRMAHEDAAVHWGRAARAVAIARPNDRQARFEALEEQGRAWLRVDAVEAGYEALVAAIDQAIKLHAPDLVARAAAAMNIDAVWQTGEVAMTSVDAVGALERALAVMPSEPSEERVLAMGAMVEAAYWTRPPDWLDRTTAEAVDAARSLGDPVTLVRALHKRNQALWRAATADERHLAAAELVAIADEHPTPPALEGLAHFAYGGTLWERAEVPAAIEQANIAHRIAEQLGSAALSTQLDYFLSTLAEFQGHLVEAERLAERAYQLYRRTRRWAAETLHTALVTLSWLEQGRAAEIDERADILLDSPYRPWFQECYAYVLVETGRVDEAARLVDGGLPPLVDCWLYLGVLGAALHVRAAIGDTDAVTTLADLLRPHPGRLLSAGTGSAFGDTHLALATAARMTGDVDTARAEADRSVALLRAAGSGPDLVRSLLLRAELAPEQADDDRRQARTIVDRHHLTHLRGRFG